MCQIRAITRKSQVIGKMNRQLVPHSDWQTTKAFDVTNPKGQAGVLVPLHLWSYLEDSRFEITAHLYALSRILNLLGATGQLAQVHLGVSKFNLKLIYCQRVEHKVADTLVEHATDEDVTAPLYNAMPIHTILPSRQQTIDEAHETNEKKKYTCTVRKYTPIQSHHRSARKRG